MRLTRIEIRGLKSYDSDVILTGADAILGGAASGKSRVREAVTFCATGKNPDVGNSIKDAALLMRGNEMSVHLEWKDGSFATRTLTRKGKTLKSNCHVSWLDEGAGLTQSEEALVERFGATEAEAIQNLSPRKIMSLSGPAQLTAFNALLDASGMGIDEILDRLSVRVAMRIAHGGDVVEPEDQSAWQVIRESSAAQMSAAHQVSLDAFLADTSSVIREKGLTGGITWSKGLVKDLAASERTKLAARQEIEDRDNKLEAPSTTLAEINAERQTHSDRIAVLRSEVEKHKEHAYARDTAVADEHSANAAVLELSSQAAPADLAAARRDRAQELRDQASAMAEPADIPAPKVVEYDEAVTARCAEMDAEAGSIDDGVALPMPPEGELLIVEPDLLAAMGAVERAEKAFAAAMSDPWTEVGGLADRVETKAVAERLRYLAVKHGADVAALDEAVTVASIEKNRVMDARKDAADENVEIQKRNNEAAAAYAKARDLAQERRDLASTIRSESSTIRGEELNRVQAANATNQRSYREACASRAVEVDRIKREGTRLDGEAAALAIAADSLERIYAEAQAHHKAAEAKLEGMDAVAPLDVAAHSTEIATLEQAIARLDETKRAVEGADARKVELEELTQEIASATASVEVARAIAWALPLIRDADLDRRKGPILERMTRFLDASKVGQRPYLEASKGKVAYGLIAGANHAHLEAGHRRSGLVLSGAESVLFNAALWFAIVNLRKPHTTVLAVEIDDLDDMMALNFFWGVGAILDDLDNAVVFTNRPLPIPKGWAKNILDAPVKSAGAA